MDSIDRENKRLVAARKKKNYDKIYRAKNKERIAEYRRRLYKKNRLRMLERGKRYRDMYPDRVRATDRRYGLKLKRKALEIVGNGKVECNACHINDIRVLNINHINGGGCKEGISSIKMYLAIYYGKRKTDDLDILCFNCNYLYYLDRINYYGFIGGY